VGLSNREKRVEWERSETSVGAEDADDSVKGSRRGTKTKKGGDRNTKRIRKEFERGGTIPPKKRDLNSVNRNYPRQGEKRKGIRGLQKKEGGKEVQRASKRKEAIAFDTPRKRGGGGFKNKIRGCSVAARKERIEGELLHKKRHVYAVGAKVDKSGG